MNNIPALVQIMAWRRPGDKPLSEPMMVSLLTHICVTRPQWVNGAWCANNEMYYKMLILKGRNDIYCYYLNYNLPKLSIVTNNYLNQWLAIMLIFLHNAELTPRRRPKCTIVSKHHWFRAWLVAAEAISLYQNQYWLIAYLTTGKFSKIWI